MKITFELTSKKVTSQKLRLNGSIINLLNLAYHHLEKIAAILAIPPPSTVKSLRSFLG